MDPPCLVRCRTPGASAKSSEGVPSGTCPATNDPSRISSSHSHDVPHAPRYAHGAPPHRFHRYAYPYIH